MEGSLGDLPFDIKEFIGRVQSKTKLPPAVGFGISNPQMMADVADLVGGAVFGLAILRAMDRLMKDGGSA